MERRQLAPGGDFEDRATVSGTVEVGPAVIRCPVELPVGGLNQCCTRVFAVGAISLSAKAVKRGQLASRGDFEDSADAKEKFVKDFVAAWTKVMNADRFELA